MATDADITFTIGFDVDKINQKEAFNKMSSSFTNYPLAKLSRPEKKELDAFVARHNEEIANQHLKRFLNTPEKGVGLLSKANKYRNEQDAISKLMGVGSVPTAPADEQYLALKQFIENNAKEGKMSKPSSSLDYIDLLLDNEVKQYSDKEVNDKLKEFGINPERVKTASSIDGSIASSADKKINDIMKERGINEGLLAKAERLKTASSIDDFVAPLADNRIDNAIKTKEEEMSKLASSIDETIGKSFEERINSIQTPNGTDTKENDIQKENKALKEQEKEKKNNAKEEKGSLIRFGKMLTTLHLIKKVLKSIKNIWKRLSDTELKVTDTELKVTQRDVKEKGFFSVDAYSAMHANVDRSHSVISRGLGYMGAAAPFSMEAFDSVLQQLQDLKLKAISGQGIADEQLVISLQRLSDTLGMGFNIKDILTDPNLNLTEFLTGLMNSVEKFLPKLNSLDDIKKSLITNDIIKALGPELANALVYNYNYNQRTGGTSTVMEQVTSKGTNAYGLIDYTKEAKNFTDALASSRAALDEFKTALGGVFAPIGKVALDKVEEKAAEGTMLINSIKSDNSGLNNVLLYTGSYALDKNQKKDKTELKNWYDENKKIAQEKFDDAKQLDSFNRILNFAFYNPTALKAGTSSVGLEEIAKKGKVAVIEQMIDGKKFSELDKRNFTDEEWTVIKDIYDNINIGNEDLAYQKDVVDIQNLKSFKKLFEQGELYDFNPNKNTPLLYLENMLGKKLYHAILIQLLSEENNFLQKAGIMKENGLSYYIKDEYDKQGNKISGTVVLQIQLTDGTHRDIPTTFEEGMVNTIVNVPLSR